MNKQRQATQIVGCGPAFVINIPDEAVGNLTIENLWFHDQAAMSIEFQHSVNPVNIRNNFINTLGEGIEIEGNLGQDNTYLVEDNVIQTLVPPSPTGESSGPPGSVAEGKEGGHPALIKLHANEGTFIVRNNRASMTGLPYGVCIMATTLNNQALVGEQVLFIMHNECQMTGQLTALLGAWGQTAPFFTGAALSGALVAHNIVSGTGTVGIGMISRTSATSIDSMVNNGHDNHFLLNDFSEFTATNANIGFDPQTHDNLVTTRSAEDIVDLGRKRPLQKVR